MTGHDLRRALRHRGLAGLTVLSLVVLLGAPSPPTAGSAGPTEPLVTPTSAPAAAVTADPEPSVDPRGSDDWAIRSERCGAGRWTVKSLGDREVSRVDVGRVVVAHVADLAAVRRPLTPLPQDGRLGPLETTVFAVTARVVEARRTESGEVQFIIADVDGSARTLLVIPTEECLVRTPAPLHERIGAALGRAAEACGSLVEGWTSVSGAVRVVAPGYWAPADQAEPAGNGLWLSAPLAFEPLGPCAAPGGSAGSGAGPLIDSR